MNYELLINIVLILTYSGAALFCILAAFKKLPEDIQSYLEQTFFLNKKWALILAISQLYFLVKIIIKLTGL